MTLLLSISANTAAMAIEALKPGRRVSPKHQAEDIKADADRNARRAENAGDPGGVDLMVPSASIGLDLLDAGQRPRQQATFAQAQSAYRDLDD